MKKATILFAFLCAISIAVMAQSTTQTAQKDTSKKAVPPPVPAPPAKPAPQFQFDYDKVIGPGAINITLRGYQVDDYFTVEKIGVTPIENSSQITAARANAYKINHQAVLDSFKNALNRAYVDFVNSEKIKWTAAQADSVKAAKVDSIAKAKLKPKSK